MKQNYHNTNKINSHIGIVLFLYIIIGIVPIQAAKYTVKNPSPKSYTCVVTRIGCGIAGFTDDKIFPLFEKAHDVENIVLPSGW